MKRFLFLAVISMMISSACQTTPPTTDADRSRTYPQSPQEIFNAAKLALSALNAEVIQSDYEGGILVGRRHLGGEMLTAVMLGKEKTLFSTYRLNLFLAGEGTHVVLRLVAAYEDGSHESEFRKAGYDHFWNELEKNLTQ